ncbi:MAG: FKBP-type peptidyl-prolyl cis-trans isomerase [Saprospiraceae bacterium]|nr:FKBP-type peptidyl-prolyl cis-trans isomerase [Saprospiraceae bacterium]
MDTLSYSIGVLFGSSLKQQGLDKINAADLAEAFDAAMNGKPTKLSKDEATQIYSKAMGELSAKASHAAKAEGEQFLKENSKKEGVVSLPSGLQYQVIKMGDGAKPSATSKVKTHYHGTLINGKVFDSSVERGEPISFPLNGVIKGWTEALQLMPVGSKWRLFIPYHLAYGERGAGADIKPYSTLIFEVELLAIEE